MKKLFLFACIFLFLCSQAKAQWVNLNSPTTSSLYSTYFSNYDIGYAVGGDINASLFLKTVNGGANWTVITNTQTKWLYDVLFIDDTTGLACGFEGAIYKTTNAGTTWEAKPSETTAWLYAMAKKSNDTIYAVGQDGKIIVSNNRGNNWTSVVSNTTQTLFDVNFYNNKYGAAVGESGEMVYTTNGGVNWAVKYMATANPVMGVWLQSPDTMWTCTNSGNVYKTTDAGQYFALFEPSTNDLNAVFFADDLNGYLIGNMVTLQTTNGGASWNSMNYPSANSMNDIYVSPDNTVMYAVGQNGSIIKNINTIGVENEIETKIALYPNPNNGIVSINLAGSYKITVLSLTGNILKTLYCNEVEKTQIDLSFLDAGAYFITFHSPEFNKTEKLIIKSSSH